MAESAKAVANAFLDIARTHGTTLTPMKLQKLIFFAHGWNLAIYDEPLIADSIEAWRFGPVIPSLYREFRNVGGGAITERASDFDFANFDIVVPELDPSDKRTRLLLEKVWEKYGGLTAIQLSNMTHLDGTPWAVARAGDRTSNNVPISDDSIKQYFKGLARVGRDAVRQ
jgi:uncharacterized phage-associated protein